MQRQAVPLLRADAPLVGTGMEAVTARDSGAVVICQALGVVDSVDSERIIVRVEGGVHEGQLSREVGSDIYQLVKFKRSNQNTCINQKPVVHVGSGCARATCSPTGPAPSTASWRSGATCWWPSCRGAATTSRTPSW
jgi:DNA-directed RNA polymerase subunit beta